ncbi:MAG: GNAT family N-acetyltransferase [Bacillota bacterium]
MIGNVRLQTARLDLRDVAISDGSTIAQWKADPMVRRMSTGLDTIITASNQEQEIERALADARETYWVIALRQNAHPIGYIRANWLESERRCAWLRFGLGVERGKGYAKEALAAALSRWFEEGCHRIDAEVYDFNLPSLGLLKALGFTQEGVRRQAHWTGEGYCDVVVFGLLSGELHDVHGN